MIVQLLGEGSAMLVCARVLRDAGLATRLGKPVGVETFDDVVRPAYLGNIGWLHGSQSFAIREKDVKHWSVSAADMSESWFLERFEGTFRSGTGRLYPGDGRRVDLERAHTFSPPKLFERLKIDSPAGIDPTSREGDVRVVFQKHSTCWEHPVYVRSHDDFRDRIQRNGLAFTGLDAAHLDDVVTCFWAQKANDHRPIFGVYASRIDRFWQITGDQRSLRLLGLDGPGDHQCKKWSNPDSIEKTVVQRPSAIRADNEIRTIEVFVPYLSLAPAIGMRLLNVIRGTPSAP